MLQVRSCPKIVRLPAQVLTVLGQLVFNGLHLGGLGNRCEKSTRQQYSWMMNPALAQLLQQRFGLLQIFGIKAFGEPLVDGGEQVVGFPLLSLLLPQPSEAGGNAEL